MPARIKKVDFHKKNQKNEKNQLTYTKLCVTIIIGLDHKKKGRC